MSSMTKRSTAQISRAAINLGIGVVGLVVIRLIVQGMPMFHDAGWIVQGKLSVMSAAVIIVDAMLLSVLIGFAVEVRACLVKRFAEVPALGTMAASLVLLICTGIAYTDFTPLTKAWPALKQIYTWSFFTLAALLLAQMTALLFQNRDRMAALILHQPMPPRRRRENPPEADETRTVWVAR
ncbi:MAG TPA: hypothetical protein VG498_08365 [Terriglobales bacterium]|nr:hypothetical protein [Terriglobales bacterium]